MASSTRGQDRSGGFRIEVVPAPRYQRVIDTFMAPFSWLMSFSSSSRRLGGTETPSVWSSETPRGEWRVLRIASSDEAERVRDETQARIEKGRDRGVESRGAGQDPRVLPSLTGVGT
jgi:hypothetical protein